MLTPDTIRAEVKRRIWEAKEECAGPNYIEALEELDQWIAGEMAKQAREYARQHYQGELAKLQKGEG